MKSHTASCSLFPLRLEVRTRARTSSARPSRFAASLLCTSLLFALAGCNSGSTRPRYASANDATAEAATSGSTTVAAGGAGSGAPSVVLPQAQKADTQTQAGPLASDPRVEMDARQLIKTLASDEFEGRGVGTKGLDLAADLIAQRFAALGLRPVTGQSGFFQPFPFTVSREVGKATTLSTGERPLALKKDFSPLSFSSEGSFSAPVVFAGYGISNPTNYQYDDYADLDVKGKVVLVLRYDPHDEKGNSRFTGTDERSGDAALTMKAAAAEAHGAVAVLLVNPPNHHGERDRLMPFSSAIEGKAGIPVIQVKQEIANGLIRAGGIDESLKSLQAKIDDTGKPVSMQLKSTASGKVEIKRVQATVKNVMAMLPGHGPNAGEFVVVGAHYDHLGRGMQGSMSPGSKDVHHGADDNASGTAALIELAGKLVRAGRLERSVLFVAFTAEEEGLHGSKYFVDHPPVSLEKIVGMLNMDMVGRIKAGTLYVGGSGTAEAFADMLKRADADSPLQIKFDGPMLGRGGFGPSDHMTFALKKIPVLFFFSGMHREYHTPNDTAERINYTGVAQAVALGQRVVNEMARMPRQVYVSKYDSGPGRFGASNRDGISAGGASLGVVPDYSAGESTTGVPISGTRDNSAAAKAGLKEGDVVVELGAKKINSIYDLTNFLSTARPGDKVKVVVLRKNERVELEATLAERGG